MGLPFRCRAGWSHLVTWFVKAAGVVGELGLAVLMVMLVPLALVVIGAPVALLVRAILEIVERF